MGHVIVTASSAALLHACGYSFRADVECPPDSPSGEARRGTLFGLLAEQKVNGGPPVPISEKIAELEPEEARRLVAMWRHALRWLDAHMRCGWVAERAFVYDPAADTARELPRLTHRDYSDARPGETVAGTADIVAIDGDSVVVYDWKTTSDGAPGVDATAQLEWLALFAARAWGYDSARIVTLKVTEDGVMVIEGEPLDMFALTAVADCIATSVAHIPTAEPTPGEHCTGRYCKAVSVCPATAQAMAQLVPDTALVRKEWRYQPVIESPDHLAHILATRPLLRKAMDQVDAAIEAYVADGPKRTTDGREIKKAYRIMPRMSQQALVELAMAKGATEEEVNGCIRSSVEGNGVRIYSGKKGRRSPSETCSLASREGPN